MYRSVAKPAKSSSDELHWYTVGTQSLRLAFRIRWMLPLSKTASILSSADRGCHVSQPWSRIVVRPWTYDYDGIKSIKVQALSVKMDCSVIPSETKRVFSSLQRTTSL